MATASGDVRGVPIAPESEQHRSDVTTTSAEASGAAEYTDFPCSVAQERFWLLDRLEPGNPSYNVAVRWRLEGRVATKPLEAAWLEIVGRHEILRTRFLEVEGKPIQRVASHYSFKLVEVDLTRLPPDARPTEGDRIGLIEARAPFDLSGGPLIRVVLLRYSPTVSVILITTHQIVSDGWSIGVMAREMGTIYAALNEQKEAPLEPLEIQYGDYALWQLEWLRQRGTAAETAYWSRQLAAVRPFEVLPDRPRPAIPTTHGAIASLVLPRELTNRMQALTAGHGVTLFAAAVATLCATLARYTGKPEIVIGTQVSDRDQVELEPMIGQFVNSLILRNDLRGDPSFKELLESVSSTIQEALEHRHIPIERLLDMVKAGRGGSNSPPVSVNFIFQRTFIENRNYGDFTLVDLPSLVAGAIYDLNLFMVERPDGWRFSCQFNTDQFEPETANRLLRYFQSALESAVERPTSRVSDLRLAHPALSDAAAARLIGPPLERPRATVLAQLSARAASAPDSIAVICGDRRVTYGQLEGSARALASQLRARQVGPHSRVAVCLSRSTERVVAILAVLKAGAAYVSLKPEDPPAHLQRLVDSSQACLVLTTPELALRIKARLGVITDVSAPAEAGTSEVSSPPEEPDAEAAVWFTSHEPVNPVGVAIAQRHLVNRLTDLQQRLDVSSSDVFVSVGDVTAESTSIEVLLPLLCGGRIVIAMPAEASDPGRLAHLLKRMHVTVLHGATEASSVMHALRPHQKIKRILWARGALEPDLAMTWLEWGAEVWALHGYAETTGCVALRRIQQRHDLQLLGQPLADTRFRVLDRTLKPAPLGAQGWLYVGGDCVSSGYLEDRETDRFIADPCNDADNARLFRTRHLARVRSDGTVEIIADETGPFELGGCQIVPTDLARGLESQPHVREAVITSARTSGTMRVTAFVVLEMQPAETASAALEELRVRIADTWPRSLQPDRIVPIESLPRTPEGEIDVRQLPSVPVESIAVEPATHADGSLERGLTAIWEELLKRRPIDVTANFFELGGHSLLAARMLARVEAEFGRRVTLGALFRAPSIRGLAQLLSNPAREFDFRQMVKLQSDGSKLPLIAINNTGVYYLLAKKLGPDQPVTSLQVFDPEAKREAMPATLEEIAAEYVQLIRRVHPSGPYVLAGWCVAGALAFEIARQLVELQLPVAQLFLIDSWVPNYLKRLPALRGLIGSYSLRWQLLRADWRRVTAGEQTVREFLNERVTLRRLRALTSRATGAPTSKPMQDGAGPGDYDKWLLQYLRACTDRYEPRPYPGRITLFRSTEEPTGWLFDPLAGWGPLARGGVDLLLVAGNHFTLFQEPGVTEMAERMSRLIGSARPPGRPDPARPGPTRPDPTRPGPTRPDPARPDTT